MAEAELVDGELLAVVEAGLREVDLAQHRERDAQDDVVEGLVDRAVADLEGEPGATGGGALDAHEVVAVLDGAVGQ